MGCSLMTSGRITKVFRWWFTALDNIGAFEDAGCLNGYFVCVGELNQPTPGGVPGLTREYQGIIQPSSIRLWRQAAPTKQKPWDDNEGKLGSYVLQGFASMPRCCPIPGCSLRTLSEYSKPRRQSAIRGRSKPPSQFEYLNSSKTQ